MNVAKLNTAYDGGLILDTGSGGGNSGGGVVINNQNKSVEITENGRTSVVHDDGFTGLGNVDINVNVPPKNQDKTVDVVENGTLEVAADSGFTGLGKVSVNVNVTSSGGGTTPVSANDVTFYDYDGTVLHSYSKDAFLALSEFPALPTREGLICQGWNYSLEDAQAYVVEYGKIDIGATYITDDGKTRLYVSVPEYNQKVALYITQSVSDGVIFNWGDGSEVQTLSGTGSKATSHTYTTPGDYTISLKVVDGCKLTLGKWYDQNNYGLLGSHDGKDLTKHNVLTKIEIGEGINQISAYSFKNCRSLSTITIPNSVNFVGVEAFRDCLDLSSLVLPNSITGMGGGFCQGCGGLRYVIVPNTITLIQSKSFYSCYSLRSFTIPNSVSEIISSAFYSCRGLRLLSIPNSVQKIENASLAYCESLISLDIPNSIKEISAELLSNNKSLVSVVIPSSVIYIYYDAFYRCYGLKVIDFRAHIAVPSLGSTSVFTDIPTDCKMVVPDALYDNWIAATNWSTYASYIVKASEFNG